LIAQGLDAIKASAWLEHQRISRAVIGIRHLNQIIALRKPHDDVAFVGGERVAHEARRPGIPRIGKALAELLGEYFGELVLETGAILRRERHVAGIGADSEHIWINEFE